MTGQGHRPITATQLVPAATEPGAPPSCAERTLAGWGNFPVQRCRVYRPERRRELRAIVCAAGPHGILARGLGRSYGDASLNEGGGVILQERLARLCAFDGASGMLRCEAGVTFREIIETFLPRGFFPAVTPGTAQVTVGGAIAADVHGKNHHRDGSFSRFVESLQVMLAGGEVHECARERGGDLFRATVGGMGLTGVIVEATMRLLPVESAYVRVEEARARDLDAVLERLESSDAGHRYSVAWIDTAARGLSLGRSVLMQGDHALRAELPRSAARAPLEAIPRRAKAPPPGAGLLLSRAAVRAFNAGYWARHRGGVRLERFDRFFYPLDAVRRWNRLYGRRGFAQYQLILPPHSARQGLIEALQTLQREGAASFLSVIKRFGDEGEGLLSFPRPGVTLTLDLPNTGEPLRRLAGRLDELVLRHGGRVYLAKDALLSPAAFAAMYPRLGEFRRLKAALDPGGRFSSSQARRLGIVEEG
jgi:FAD/FMN-containing dehydrogenase